MANVVADVQRLADENIKVPNPDLKLLFRSKTIPGKYYLIHTHFEYSEQDRCSISNDQVGIVLVNVAGYFKPTALSWLLQVAGFYIAGDSLAFKILETMEASDAGRWPMAIVDKIHMSRGGGSVSHQSLFLEGLVYILTRVRNAKKPDTDVFSWVAEFIRHNIVGITEGNYDIVGFTLDFVGDNQDEQKKKRELAMRSFLTSAEGDAFAMASFCNLVWEDRAHWSLSRLDQAFLD